MSHMIANANFHGRYVFDKLCQERQQQEKGSASAQQQQKQDGSNKKDFIAQQAEAVSRSRGFSVGAIGRKIFSRKGSDKEEELSSSSE